MRRSCIAILGKQDTPTDAVEEYCRYLGEAMQAEDYDLKIERVPWVEHGWGAAVRKLRRRAKEWKGTWVLVQYTALAWSARGFPIRFARVLKTLKAAGARVAVVYHDAEPYGGTRVIDRLRRRVQLRTMRKALRVSGVAVFTVPPERLSWPKTSDSRTLFIPVGANLPTSEAASRKNISTDEKLSIAVFGITGGDAGKKEVENIAEAVRFAASQVGNLRLIVLGRNSESFEGQLKASLNGSAVELHVLGLLSSEDVTRTLCASDVLLFVRGHISTRRGSAIAGIACALPIVAFEGTETSPPITEAGLALYSPQRKADLGDVLVRVLKDERYRASLAQRSWVAHAQYFSWRAIAARYAKFMKQ